MLLSVVVPMHNEEENVAPFCREVTAAFSALNEEWELVLVDDGSTDRTKSEIVGVQERHQRVRLVETGRRQGQSAALCYGFAASGGRFIGTLDGDLQNDPNDLPAMLGQLLSEEADMVTGWRRRRRDSLVRKASSRIANWTRNRVTGVSIRDIGCSTRVFRASCLSYLPLFFDGMHRFFPVLFKLRGFMVIEVPVNHRHRAAGRTKYGIRNRLWRGVRDLCGICWVKSRFLSIGRDVVLHSAESEVEQIVG